MMSTYNACRFKSTAQTTHDKTATDPFGDACCGIDHFLIMLLQKTVDEVFIRLIIIKAAADKSSEVSSIRDGICVPDCIDD